MQSSIIEAIQNEHTNITGILIQKNGETRLEHYQHGYKPDDKTHVCSVTKSIISILIGIALDRGLIKSIDQHILEFFPDHTVDSDQDVIHFITIRHLLTMSAPYKFAEEPYLEYFQSSDRVKTALHYIGGDDGISEFRYTPFIGPDILSGILKKVTHQSVLAFANEVLFQPLDIHVEKSLILQTEEEEMAFQYGNRMNGWVADEQGTNCACYGLTLSATDMTKVAQLYMHKGRWNDTQIVSKQWVKDSTSIQIRWNDMAYGFLWWVMQDGAFAAIGDSGNVIFCDPKNQISVAITASLDVQAKDRIALIYETILPALKDEIA